MSASRRLASLSVALLALARLAAGSQEAPPAVPTAEPVERTVWARLAGPDPPSSVEVLEQGLRREVQAFAAAPEGGWRSIVYVDLPLASREGLFAAARTLEAHSSDLTTLGTVEVILADTVSTHVLEPTRDSEELRAAIEYVLEQADGSGRWAAAPEETTEPPSEQAVLDTFYDQEELLSWQDDLLADSLWTTSSSDRPTAVFLVRDAVEVLPADLARSLIGERASVRFEPRLQSSAGARLERLERALAVTGFMVFPFQKEETAEQAGPSPLERLAAATGGSTLTSDSAVGEVLRSMNRAFRVDYLSAGRGDEPVPLDLRAPDGARVVGPRWATALPPREVALSRARRHSQGEAAGRLEVEAVFLEPESGSTLLETLVRWSEGRPADSSDLRVSILRQEIDREPELASALGNGTPIRDSWIFRQPLRAPYEADLTVVVEDLRTGMWGAATAEASDESLAVTTAGATLEESGAPPPAVRFADADPRLPDAEPASRRRETADLVGEPRREARGVPRQSLIKIVPPRGRRLTGVREFKTLLTNMAIQKVVFLLDGVVVHDDTRRPFTADIDLGAEPREMTITAVAYSGQGAELGRDQRVVNRVPRRRGLTLTRVEPRPRDEVEVSAEYVASGDGPGIERVELYRNERLGATFTKPPFQAVLPGPARADADYVRAVAYLRDGSFVEDVRLLGSDALSERVEVNLVEVYAVVTDRDGNPVKGLQGDDFTVLRGGREIAVERFSVAEQATLDLGLVVDTSLSMYSLMPDTRKAAAAFLSDLLTPLDRAFLVDFDNRPRLAHPTTGRLAELLGSLGSLRAGGATALYDSILFAILHFDQRLGRKALILLTDGDDYQSQFSYRRIYQTASDAGLPIYFIALGGFDEERPSFRKADLESLAKVSGGRVFYPASMEDVGAAYQTISDELRSQYVLAFTTAEGLEAEELADIKVRLENRQLRVRYVVGTQ